MIQLMACNILGDIRTIGIYLLRMWVSETSVVQFGRFQQATPILIPLGDYIYVGSTLGTGSMSLPRSKKLHWHLDFLLDELAAELVQVMLICSDVRLEQELGQMLLADEATAVLALGLGATDVPGNTHLLSIPAEDTWWQQLGIKLASQFGEPP